MSTSYHNARILGTRELCDITTNDGLFQGIRPASQDSCRDTDPIEMIDLKGALVSPPFCDTHLHLDYAYTGQRDAAQNVSGTLFEGIARWHEVKRTATVESMKKRARRAIREEILAGTQHIRSHVDVTDPQLTGLRALLELREELQEIVDIQIVAFPQEGVLRFERSAELLEEALTMGADAVGAIPHFELTEDQGKDSLRQIVSLASRHEKLIDVHCDETDDPHSRFLQTLVALVHAEGIGRLTTASHTCSLGSTADAYFAKLLPLLTMSRINFAVAPAENLHLQGRQDSYPKRRGITRVKELIAAGLNVSLGQDSMCDPWYPLGNGNMLNVLDFAVHVSQLMSLKEIDESFDMITTNGATTMALSDYGIAIGNPADFIVLDATSPFDALRRRAEVTLSVRHGETLFSRRPSQVRTEWKE